MNILIDTAGKKSLMERRQRLLAKQGIVGEVKPWQLNLKGKQIYGLWIPEEYVDREKRMQRRKNI